MKRIYISGWQDKEPVGGGMTPVDVLFVFRPEQAHAWPSKEQAQSQCQIFFNSYDVKVDWTEDGTEYICKFQVEEYSPRAFVLFCDGPFVFKSVRTKQKV